MKTVAERQANNSKQHQMSNVEACSRKVEWKLAYDNGDCATSLGVSCYTLRKGKEILGLIVHIN